MPSGRGRRHSPRRRARDVLEIARRVRDEHGGEAPATMEGPTALRGVGPKIAAMTLAVAFGIPIVPVDVHVHRIVNRWGLAATRTPKRTMTALREGLPRRDWIETNEWLVPFGEFVCAGTAPRCSTRPPRSTRRRVGVTSSG